MKTFAHWLASAKRGSRFEYHRGDLVHDSNPDYVASPFALAAAQARYAAWQAYETGRCTLLQKRHGKDDYSYFAVRL